jgi:hypothetical protein
VNGGAVAVAGEDRIGEAPAAVDTVVVAYVVAIVVADVAIFLWVAHILLSEIQNKN